MEVYMQEREAAKRKEEELHQEKMRKMKEMIKMQKETKDTSEKSE